MRPTPVTMPSPGVFSISSSRVRRARCAASTSAPYSTNVPGSQRSSTFSRAVRCCVARRRATASGPLASSVRRLRAQHFGQVGADVIEIDACGTSSRRRARRPLRARQQRRAFEHGIAFRDRDLARTRPLSAASMTCSIFIDSITMTCWPRRTASPAPHVDADDGALHRRLSTRAVRVECLSSRRLCWPPCALACRDAGPRADRSCRCAHPPARSLRRRRLRKQARMPAVAAQQARSRAAR